MPFRNLFVVGLVALAPIACGPQVEGTTPTSPVSKGLVPPPRPSSSFADGATRWFAVRTLHLGINDPITGQPAAKAWTTLGYNLDGLAITSAHSSSSFGTCKRHPKSPANVLIDGEAGIDNNLGQHMLAVIKSLKSDFEDESNAKIHAGALTLLLRLDNVGPDDNASVPGALYVAAPYEEGKPKGTDGDQWPVSSGSLVDGKTLAMPKYAFPRGYMSKGTWVSGDIGQDSVGVTLPLLGYPVELALGGAVISFKPSDGSNGVIAGATPSLSLVDALRPMLRAYGVCPGNATHDILVEYCHESADLVMNARGFQDATKACDAVSVGLGFVAVATRAPTKVSAPPPAPPDACH